MVKERSTGRTFCSVSFRFTASTRSASVASLFFTNAAWAASSFISSARVATSLASISFTLSCSAAVADLFALLLLDPPPPDVDPLFLRCASPISRFILRRIDFNSSDAIFRIAFRSLAICVRSSRSSAATRPSISSTTLRLAFAGAFFTTRTIASGSCVHSSSPSSYLSVW